jgi:hypothetical protein
MDAHRQPNLIEHVFCRLETHCEKLASSFTAATAIAATIIWQI